MLLKLWQPAQSYQLAGMASKMECIDDSINARLRELPVDSTLAQCARLKSVTAGVKASRYLQCSLGRWWAAPNTPTRYALHRLHVQKAGMCVCPPNMALPAEPNDSACWQAQLAAKAWVASPNRTPNSTDGVVCTMCDSTHAAYCTNTKQHMRRPPLNHAAAQPAH